MQHRYYIHLKQQDIENFIDLNILVQSDIKERTNNTIEARFPDFKQRNALGAAVMLLASGKSILDESAKPLLDMWTWINEQRAASDVAVYAIRYFNR